jgi:hypothetical protein
MKSMVFGLCALAFAGWSTAAPAAETLPPASQRFLSLETQESPDFQRHLVPLMGRVGCNGRACHGSFQGQGGFRLSLFGYDFKMDHAGLMDRIDTDKPLESYALQKPAMVVEHKGGMRLKPGSWEYNLFLQWIKTGAKPRPDTPADLVRLEVTPSEIQFSKKGEQVQLKAVAVWDDGTREDVTCLTRFQSNDPAVAEVSAEGLVTGVDAGDSHIVAFYDNGIVPVPVLRPYSDKTGDRFPQVAARTKIDELVLNKLAKLGAVPSDVCTDEEFLRRVSLDVAGTLPSPSEVRAFLADSTADKRARKVEELMATPAYAARWTTMLCDITGNNDQQLNNITATRGLASQEWYDWIYKRVAENVPYDQLMEGIVLAVGRNPGESYYDYCVRTSRMYGKEPTERYADRPGLTYFWGRQNFDQPEERAIGFAYAFMGIRIQCAQCHKHPFDEWTQEDFKQFQAFFDRVRFGKSTPVSSPSNRTADQEDLKKVLAAIGVEGKKTGDVRRQVEQMAREGKVVPASDLAVLAGNRTIEKGKDKKGAREVAGRGTKVARLLKSEELIDVGTIDDPRKPLMEWLRNPENGLFARAFVNRVWAQYFHRGIVEPTDDLSLANPPSNEPLLHYLADGFVQSGYDMKWLHRTIVNSDTYQRSWRPNETNRLDERNFSRAVPRRLPAEVALDAVKAATAGSSSNMMMKEQLDGRMVLVPGSGARNGGIYALNVFGRSLRENNCDCERSMEPSLLQTLFLRNDGDTLAAIDRRDGWLAETAKQMSVSFVPEVKDGEPGERGDRKSLKATYDKRMESLRDDLKQAKEAGDKKMVERIQRQIEAAKAKYAALSNSTDSKPASDSKAETPAVAAAPKSDSGDRQRIVEEAYLRTLTRFPTDEELKIGLEAIASAKDPVSGLRDLLWALLNTKEFIVNH